MTEPVIRAPRAEDASAIADVVNRASSELFGEAEENEASVRTWLGAPELELRVAEGPDGVLLGYVDFGAHPGPRFWVDLRVPRSEPGEARAALLDWAESRAEEHAAGRDGALVRAGAASVDEPAKALLKGRGYNVVRHSYTMRIELDPEPPAPVWPEGLVVRKARLEDVEAAYEAQMEAFEDSWDFQREPFEEWLHWMADEAGFDPSLWFLAEDAGELAGIVLGRQYGGDPKQGWIRVLGVRRPWRRRGLGRALLLEAFREFRSRGFTRAGLGVDAESLTGANRLYESAGMRIERRLDIYERPLGTGSLGAPSGNEPIPSRRL